MPERAMNYRTKDGARAKVGALQSQEVSQALDRTRAPLTRLANDTGREGTPKQVGVPHAGLDG